MNFLNQNIKGQKSGMRFRIVIPMFLLIWLPLAVYALDAETSGKMVNTLKSHFANYYQLDNKDIHIQLIHVPKKEISFPVRIESQHGINLGHQTLWLVESLTGKKYPVTLFVGAEMPILIARRKIIRRSALNRTMVKLQKVLIHGNASNYIQSFEEIEDMMAVQIIRTGKGITRSMIRPLPDMKKGEKVRVKLISGDLIIETNGKVKKDGQIGDMTQVILEKTGKRITGEIMAHNLVKMELNY